MELSSTAAALALLTTIYRAAPTYNTFESTLSRRESSSTDIFNSINAWIADADNVNAFLDIVGVSGTAVAGSALAAGAQIALNSPNNEPMQLMVESSISSVSPAGVQAAAMLNKNIANVISNLQLIIADLFRVGSVLRVSDIIDGAWCGTDSR